MALDERYMWAHFDEQLDELESNRDSVVSLLSKLELKLNSMGNELESLSRQAQSAKKAQIRSDSENAAMLARLRYIQAVKQLSSDVVHYQKIIETVNADHAAMTLKHALLALKSNLTHIYETARTHSTLVDPIGRAHHSTWENTLLSHSRTSAKREISNLRSGSIGMRLLLPPDVIKAVVSLLDSASKHTITIANAWLDDPENLERVTHVASRLATSFRDFSLGSASHTPLTVELTYLDLQLPQLLFWLCRTTQELRTLILGPPTLSSPSTGSPRLFSPRTSKNDAKSLIAYIQSFGAASYVFERYWTQIEPSLTTRLGKIATPPTPITLSHSESFLREVHDINTRFWISTKMLWYDTPDIVRHLLENGVSNLEDYLCLTPGRISSTGLQGEYPVPVPQLSAFSLPHAQVEQLSLRWAGIVDSSLLPLYERLSTSQASLDDYLAMMTQLNLFWANARSGPWLALSASGFPPALLVLRLLPAVHSLRAATTVCATALETASPNERAASADSYVWSHHNPFTAWLRLLTTCLCMLVCCPGLLAVEDFLLDSLQTPIAKANPTIAKMTYERIWSWIEAGDRVVEEIGNSLEGDGVYHTLEISFWTHGAVIHVLNTLKLGSIKTVLLLKLQELLKAVAQSSSAPNIGQAD